jgi:UDP-glucuronate decarboxylase
MLHLARDTGAGLLQASTSEVYGDPTVSPQSESYWGNVNPIGIRSCYDEGKRAAETLCFDYLRQYDVDARVIRIFNTYGPNMELGDGRVVSNFIVPNLNASNLMVSNSIVSNYFVSNLILSNLIVSNLIVSNLIVSNLIVSNLIVSNSIVSNLFVSNLNVFKF